MSVKSREKAKNVVRKTRELLSDPQSWQKGSYGGVEGPNCMFGGIVRVISGDRYTDVGDLVGDLSTAPFMTLTETVELIMSVLDHDRFEEITEFNDNEYTTHADVMELLDRAVSA